MDSDESLQQKGGSTVSDATLRKYNKIGCVLHGVQGTLMLVASQAVPSIKNFKKQLTTSFLEYDNATRALIPATKDAFEVEIGLMAAVFVLMSAVAHGLVLAGWSTYLDDIARQTNRARWYEYAVSSSLMICAIAILFGCYDVGSLILMFLINASMNFFGLLMEKMNPPTRARVDWSPFIFGCVAGLASWIVVCL